jgi:O-antigen/teichoic acid export membrane protein
MNTVIVEGGVTTGLITGAVTVLASLILMYFPGLNVWFAAKPSEYKQWFFLILTVLVGAAIATSSCLNLWVFMACDKVGAMTLVQVVVAVLIAVPVNQGVYRVLPEPKAVTMVKEERE